MHSIWRGNWDLTILIWILSPGFRERMLLDMEDTLRQVEEMHPDSLTVHTLAIKGRRDTDRREENRIFILRFPR